MLKSTDHTNKNPNSGGNDRTAKDRIIAFLTSEGMRYLFIGGCTTLVNLVVFTVLCRVIHLEVNISNIISVSVSLFLFPCPSCLPM